MRDIFRKVEQADEFLSHFHDLLQTQISTEAIRWQSELTKLRNQSRATRAVIGFLGATGAGKSALINAVLEEENVVPTNCVRACTSVVTEISYNEQKGQYRAEIEFLKREEWQAELVGLLRQIRNEGVLSQECDEKDSGAWISLSKLNAVYPGITKAQLANITVEELMDQRSASYLGSTHHVTKQDGASLCDEIRKYVDSKERAEEDVDTDDDGDDDDDDDDDIDEGDKSDGDDSDGDDSDSNDGNVDDDENSGDDDDDSDDKDGQGDDTATQEPELWPWIRVVRIYISSFVLESGAVLVDLPGVQDQNAARNAVAANYVKECTNIFVIAPIARAVDNKVAKTLLDRDFKQQLNLDGSLDKITFVCTQTDGISLTEARKNLKLPKRTRNLFRRLDASVKEIRTLEAKRDRLHKIPGKPDSRSRKNKESRAPQASAKQLTEDEAYLNKPGDPRKRKPDEGLASDPKRLRATNSRCDGLTAETSDDPGLDLEETSNSCEVPSRAANRSQHLPNVTDTELDYVGSRLQDVQTQNKVAEIERKLAEINQETYQIRQRLTEICIETRNEYARRAIKKDFVAGIKEFDEEVALEANPATFDPTEEIRDYVRLENALNVFCVSSRAFQKIKGRLCHEAFIPGYKNDDATEIPQLQSHCWVLADTLRIASFQMFLVHVRILYNSLDLWSADKVGDRARTITEVRQMRSCLEKLSHNLSDALTGIMTSAFDAIGAIMETHLGDLLISASEEAHAQALTIASKWGAPVNVNDRALGGLHWRTYQATANHSGYFVGQNGVNDFNRDLCKPLINKIMHTWEQVFVQGIPCIIENHLPKFGEAMEQFRKEIASFVHQYEILKDFLQPLAHQIQAYTVRLQNVLLTTGVEISSHQKTSNRAFTPTIQDMMVTTYEECSAQKGKGMFQRMKDVMSEGVAKCSEHMYNDSVDRVQTSISSWLSEVTTNAMKAESEIMSGIQIDCMQLLRKRDQGCGNDDKPLKESIKELLTQYPPDLEDQRSSDEASRLDDQFQASDLDIVVSDMMQPEPNFKIKEETIDETAHSPMFIPEEPYEGTGAKI